MSLSVQLAKCILGCVDTLGQFHNGILEKGRSMAIESSLRLKKINNNKRMKINWTSKISIVAVLMIGINIAAFVPEVYPQWATVSNLVGGILVIVLRQLQGTEVNVGKKTIKL